METRLRRRATNPCQCCRGLECFWSVGERVIMMMILMSVGDDYDDDDDDEDKDNWPR